jgi:predicted ATP-dependent endonuclease of OLD family
MATKLIKAKIRNFKPIKNFEAEVNGQNFWLIGENGKGKTSFQQLLKIAMGDADSIPPSMIADGHFWLDKDGKEYQSKVIAKDGKVSIKVTLPDGSIEDKRTVIRGLFGGVDFPVHEFVEWSKTAEGRRKQIKEFKSMLPQDCIDIIDGIEKEIEKRYADRTEINSKIKSLKGYISECKLFGDDLKVQSVDATTLNAELEKANAHNNKLKDVKARFEERAKVIQAKVDRITEIAKQIEELKAEAAELERTSGTETTTQKQAEAYLAKTLPIDTAPIIASINNISDTNVKAKQAEEQIERMNKLSEYEVIAGEYTVEIDLKREAIREALRDIDSPVKGLTYEGETLIYNGNVVDDTTLSTSEIIELGCKMAMAKNPDCGILFVSQGESLGNERLKLIQDLAKKNNWQIIAEQMVRGNEKLEVELMVEN